VNCCFRKPFCSAWRELFARLAVLLLTVAVQSKVTADILRQFVSVLKGKAADERKKFRGTGEQDLMGRLFMR
jgi:hypothetical protein